MSRGRTEAATATGGASEDRGDVMADMAILVAVLAEQVTTASTETERWFLAFFECLTAIEARTAELRAFLPSAGEAAAVAADHLGAITSLVMNAMAGLQVQDILRQQLGAVTSALASLEHQCQAIASRRCTCLCSGNAGDTEDVAAILSRLERTYVMQAQRAAHFRAIALRAAK